MNSFSLKNRGALVTGSSRGIGAGLAEGLEEAGASVIRHGLPNHETSDQPIIYADLMQDDAPGGLMEEAFSMEPALNILVCNAGSFFDVPFLEMDHTRFEKTVRLNIDQHYFLIQAFAKKLVAAGKGGSVVIISSINGMQAEEDSTAYDMSKGALVMLTRTLAVSLAPYQIRVNGIAPGLIRTPITAPWMDAKPEKVAHYKRKILAGRVGTPEDCAGACVFLSSDAARYITGQTLLVDGGLSVVQVGLLP